MIQSWLNVLFWPKETLALEKPNASILRGFIYLFVAGIISGSIVFLIARFFPGVYLFQLTGYFGADYYGFAKIFIDIYSSIYILLLVPFLTIISGFVFSVIFFVVARLFGGKGTFTSFFYLYSVFSVPVSFLATIPLIGQIIGLYSWYLIFLALKESMELSSNKAILAIAAVFGLIFVLVFLAIFFLFFIVFIAAEPTDFSAQDTQFEKNFCSTTAGMLITDHEVTGNTNDIKLLLLNQTGSPRMLKVDVSGTVGNRQVSGTLNLVDRFIGTSTQREKVVILPDFGQGEKYALNVAMTYTDTLDMTRSVTSRCTGITR